MKRSRRGIFFGLFLFSFGIAFGADRYGVVHEAGSCGHDLLVQSYGGETPVLGSAVQDPLRLLRRVGSQLASVTTEAPSTVTLWGIQRGRQEASGDGSNPVSSEQTAKHFQDVKFEVPIAFLEVHPSEPLFVAGSAEALYLSYMPSQSRRYETFPIHLPDGADRVTRISFSPDGRFLVVFTQRSFLIFAIRDSKTPIVVAPAEVPAESGGTAKPIDQAIAAIPVPQRPTELTRVQLKPAFVLDLPAEVLAKEDQAVAATWAASGDYLLLAFSRSIYRVSFKSGREPVVRNLLRRPEQKRLSQRAGTIRSVAISPGGSYFVLGWSDGEVLKGYHSPEKPWRSFDLFGIDSPLIQKHDRSPIVSVNISSGRSVLVSTANGNDYVLEVPPDGAVRVLHRIRVQPILLESRVYGGKPFLH